MDEIEIWKDIPGYEGLYEVSNIGRIKSLNNKNNRWGKERIMNPNLYNRGYYIIGLTKDKIRKKILVHQLVAIAFLGHKINRYNLIIDHINNIKTDNRVENLQIVSPRLNVTKDKNRRSNYRGIYFNKEKQKWQAQIHVNNKHLYLGRFNTEKEASLAYEEKLNKINKH
jgi:hypothetical protein